MKPCLKDKTKQKNKTVFSGYVIPELRKVEAGDLGIHSHIHREFEAALDSIRSWLNKTKPEDSDLIYDSE